MRTKQLEFKKGEISQPDHSKKLKVMVAGGQRAEGRGQRSEGRGQQKILWESQPTSAFLTHSISSRLFPALLDSLEGMFMFKLRTQQTKTLSKWAGHA